MDSFTKNLTYNHFNYTNPLSEPETFMMHSHNSYELVFFERGNATYIIEDRKYSLKKNDLVFIRPLLYHYIEIQPNSEYTRFNLAFSEDFIGPQLLQSVPEGIEVINCPKGGIISDIFAKMDYYRLHLPEEAFIDVLQSLTKELIYNLQMTEEGGTAIPAELSPLLTQALEYINENLFSIKDIKEVCAQFFVSEQYFFRQFQTQLKTTPKKYLNTKRLLHAQMMLWRGKKPIEVYQECGFETYVGFYKQYVKTFGYPPSQEKKITTF